MFMKPEAAGRLTRITFRWLKGTLAPPITFRWLGGPPRYISLVKRDPQGESPLHFAG